MLLSLLAAALSGAPDDDRLDRLSAYAGTWKLETSGSPARNLRNDCWRSEAFYACAQFVDGRQQALIVFRWDETAHHYRTTVIPTAGAVSSGKLFIRADEWTFPWSETNELGFVTYYRVDNHFDGPDRIAYRKERSVDNTHWTVIESGVETRP